MPNMDGKKKLEELVAGLDGVTPGFGRWIRLFGDRTVYTRDPADGCRLQAVVRADDPGQNAILDHIARCDPDTIRSISDALKAMEEENERLREALTPSGETKAAYIGDFYMGVTLSAHGQEDYRRVQIPWTTIKEIMAAIRERALANTAGQEGGR